MLITIPLFLSAFAGADDTDNFKTIFEPNAMSNRMTTMHHEQGRDCQRCYSILITLLTLTGVGDRQTPYRILKADTVLPQVAFSLPVRIPFKLHRRFPIAHTKCIYNYLTIIPIVEIASQFAQVFER